jgi:RHS repeat-associated protein
MYRAPRARLARRLASFALVPLVALLAAGCPTKVPAPLAGVPDFQAAGLVDVPLARVNVLGGNLVVARRDLDFDTRLGTLSLGATWNSAAGAWRWSFELEYDGAAFVDASGARYSVRAVPDGAAVPGSVWVRVDARTLRSKGGLVHEFGADGRLAAVRWASGTWPRIEYRTGPTPAGVRLVELVQVSAPGESNVVARLTWDAAGRLASVEDRAGRRATFAWNAAGQLVQARDAFDLARGLPGHRYGYAAGALVSIETSERVRAEYGYAEGRVATARAVGLGSPELRFAYASRAAGGFETRVTDPLGAVSVLGWDGTRRLTDVANAAGERARWTFAGLRPASFTAADGSVTRWTFLDDEAVEERQASGRVVSFSYQPAGEDRSAPWRRPLRRASDGLGVLEERGYDGAGRLLRATNGAGESTSFGWSGQNLLATVVDPAGLETRYGDPGEHGHPRRIERGGSVETLDYDTVGNVLVGRGNGIQPPGVVARGYDEDRNLASLELADLDQVVVLETRTLTIEHRSDGQVARIARPFGGDSEFVYDALGRAIERRDRADGVWRSTRFARDALGRATEVARPNGMRTLFQYDAAGRRSSVAHLRGGAFEGGASLVWRAGRLEEVLDAAHGFEPERYAYDAAGRLASVAYPGGDVLELGYDGRSRVASERYRLASGAELRRLEHRYDSASRQTELRDGDASVLRRQFSAGRLAREEFGNGLARTYAYDGDGFLAEAALRTAAGGLVERSLLEREPLAGLAPAVAWRASTTTYGTLPATSYEHYWLAPVGEGVAGARVGGFAHDANGAAVEALAYDVLGNLLRVGGASDPAAQSFQYDAERTRLRRIRLASGGPVHDYSWDEAGFALSRDGEALTWDGGGRPTAVGTRAELEWDALGRPVSAVVDGVAVRMLFGGRVRADASGTPVALELGAVRLHVLGNHHYRHVDFRGNVKLVTDAAGRVISHARYAPYGADLMHGAADPESGFAQGRAAGGDLLLLGARLYDPDAGRFLAPDPVFQLVSQHVYADGNPVWFWDPDGRESQVSGYALGLGVAGMHVGVGLIAFGGPAGMLPGIGIYVFSASYAIGLAAPDVGNDGPLRFGAGLGSLLERPWSLTGAAFGGFATGQATQRPPVAAPPEPKPFDDSSSLTSLGGPAAVPGCSPATLASAPRADRLILPLAGVQFALALVLVWQRARERARGGRHGGS